MKKKTFIKIVAVFAWVITVVILILITNGYFLAPIKYFVIGGLIGHLANRIAIYTYNKLNQ